MVIVFDRCLHILIIQIMASSSGSDARATAKNAGFQRTRAPSREALGDWFAEFGKNVLKDGTWNRDNVVQLICGLMGWGSHTMVTSMNDSGDTIT